MAVFRNAKDLSAHQEQKFQRVRKSLEVEHDASVDAIKGHMLRLTSGNIPTKTFIRLNHPLGRGGGRFTRSMNLKGRRRRVRFAAKGGVPLLPINKQSGRLQKSLRLLRRRDAMRTSRLWFTAPYAPYVLGLGGTKKMVARGYWQAVQREARRERARILRAGLGAI